VSWAGRDTGVAALDAPHAHALAGQAVASATWSGLTIDEPGTYSFAADAASVRRADEPTGYPQRASDTQAERSVRLTVVEPSDAPSR
jgi:hypothetical protein